MQKTLEQEFRQYKEHHMYEMSVSALIMHGNDGLYNNNLLKDYKDLDLSKDYANLDSKSLNKKKAYYIIDDLYDKAQDGESDLYYAVYEMCWKSIEDEITDKESLRLTVNYDE